MRRHRHCRRRHRRCLPDSGESPPGAPRPASAHVIPGPPLPPPLAREAASSAQPSPRAATWPAPCWGARGGGVLSLGPLRGCGRPPRGALLPNARKGRGGVPVTGREPHCADSRGCAPEALPGRPRPPAFAGALEHLPPLHHSRGRGGGGPAGSVCGPPGSSAHSRLELQRWRGWSPDTHRSQAGAALAPPHLNSVPQPRARSPGGG